MKQNNLSPKDHRTLFERLLLARECEQKIRAEYFKDEMKTPVHLGIGGEAISIGAHFVFPPNTKYFATYRNHAIYLSVSNDPKSFFAELYGRSTGCGKGKAGSMHLSCPEKGLVATSAVVATTIPIAVGAALGQAFQKHPEPIVVFFGDGAVEEGAFWESLNFACLKRLPVIFVCEDNDLAIHTKKEDRRGIKNFQAAVEAFDCHYAAGDGTDILEIVETTRKMKDLAAETKKPVVLHYHYFRFLEHVGPSEDFKFGYRPKPDGLDTYDPLEKYQAWLLENGFSKSELESIRNEVLGRIEEAVAYALASPFPPPGELFTDVFSDGTYKPLANEPEVLETAFPNRKTAKNAQEAAPC